MDVFTGLVGSSFSMPGHIVPGVGMTTLTAAVSDYVVQLPADDVVVRLPMDDVSVLCPADYEGVIV